MVALLEDWKVSGKDCVCFTRARTPNNCINLAPQAGKTPKAYNQNHIKTCEGPMGKTTLFEAPGKAPCRDLGTCLWFCLASVLHVLSVAS